MILSGDLFYKVHPILFWVLYGEQDGGGRNSDVRRVLVLGCQCEVLFRRVQTGPGRLVVCEMFYQLLVALDLMHGCRCRADDMRDPFFEPAAPGILVETDGFFCAGECCQYTGGGKTLYVDDRIIFCSSDLFDEVEEMTVFVLFFIPDEGFMNKGVMGQQGFIPFPDHKVYLRIGEMGVQLFYDASG